MFSAELTLVNIIPSHLIREKWKGWKKLDEGDRTRADDLMYSEAESAMASFCAACGIEGAGEVLHGNPGEAISSLADERSSDLIVMGARGLSYLQSILVGSTTEQVLRSSPCPVLVVH
jgi:nucleotide-binding universal stress UspA family protein